MKENPIRSLPGIPVLLAILVVVAGCAWMFIAGVQAHADAQLIVALVVSLVAAFCLVGLYMVEPNQAAVVSLFGKYVGTVKEPGLRWNSPFYGKRKVSLRVRNFESGKLKVNELDGSPIEIAAVIVWQVLDSAEAVYNVDDYESFVHIQSESALRTMATSYPYDQHEEGQV
jgi:regulator of protease activity HflC (stomatin/prohibitin superfamily)